MTTTVSIDRSSLSLAALVIDDTTAAPYMLMGDGLGRPAITWRLLPMPDSNDVHGTEYVAAVKEQSGLPLRVMVKADTAAALDSAVTALEDALSQFTYSVTVTVAGVSKVWSCSPASYGLDVGQVEFWKVQQNYEVLTITIPVYPIAS